MWGALSGERTGLPFIIAAGPRQRILSWVRVQRDSWPYFIVSDSRLPQPEGTGPRIYIPQEQGGPVLPPGIGFPFRRLLRLAGLWWRYLNPPSRGVNFLLAQEIKSESESESHCDWQSVSLSILVSSPVWGSWPDISYCLTVNVLSLGGRPLWREDGSVVCKSVCSIRCIVSMYNFYILHVSRVIEYI
jgi:hypothetical protein